jgi:DNA-binding NarL/FixJ family response regulator
MFLSTDPSIRVIGEAENCQDAVDQARSLRPDVVLMDLLMPEGAGVEAIAEIKRRMPNVKIVVLTMYGGKRIVRAAMRAGADGYLSKNTDGDELLEAIHAVRSGDVPLDPRVVQYLPPDLAQRKDPSGYRPLTVREKEVLRLVADGLNNHEIAQVLDLSTNTAKAHVSNILSKLDVSGRAEAVVLALQLGLIRPHQEG